MTTLTNDQIRQLNTYSTYVTPPAHPLFTLKQLQDIDFLSVVQAVTGIDNRTVAASYLMRRYGMFASTQFVMLATYDEVWLGDLDDLQFAAHVEYGNKGISMYINKNHYVDIEKLPRQVIIRKILKDQIHSLLIKIREHSSVSPLTLWENVFGFLLWHYAVMLSHASTSKQAKIDMEILKSDEVWDGIAPKSLFNTYLKGLEPAQLLNTTVRTTCCFSKDVPGLLKCGFCPHE
jgi:ferric iron reductase protein FhuF